MKTAITPTRAENFSEWYQNLITAADLAENAPVRGCMTIKPYGWAIWELMRDEMDRRIKTCGVQNAQFPLLIPINFFNREAEHVAGFAKEAAVVTHYRLKMIDGTLQPDPDSKLTEPYIIRPTSETIIGDAMSRWVQSYRDLPLKLNQWVNVMRWEMRPRLFLRTSEFYWQEGHNAFATHDDANADARKMHRVYGDYMREVLAIPSIMGEKTPEERFAGADHTYTLEHIMQDGKALQAGTSHDLGQHFSKSFGIQYLDTDGQLKYAWTTSWGVSTRMMGSLFMSHSDDDGLVLLKIPTEKLDTAKIRIRPQDEVCSYINSDKFRKLCMAYAESGGPFQHKYEFPKELVEGYDTSRIREFFDEGRPIEYVYKEPIKLAPAELDTALKVSNVNYGSLLKAKEDEISNIFAIFGDLALK